jgi:hypothetical protein
MALVVGEQDVTVARGQLCADSYQLRMWLKNYTQLTFEVATKYLIAPLTASG